ncbi:hypothetical protein Nepgr_018173 [Nepenthes gracilis]|uniref:Uncharacterized protein n=1 Tax=Nepenthes gracilis TaxID=150966 RepID=A0AAD3XSU7_NEPGR|nr:hypothetical protein Nepgr_018173 [Nepenthes gracilis]
MLFLQVAVYSIFNLASFHTSSHLAWVLLLLLVFFMYQHHVFWVWDIGEWQPDDLIVMLTSPQGVIGRLKLVAMIAG